MKLCLHTDSVGGLPFAEALDLAESLGIEWLEIAAGGQSSAPHMDIAELLSDASRRSNFASAISSRGLGIAAVNCSAWPLHPVYGDQHVQLIRDSIRLAGQLEVTTIVTMSGCPGDSSRSRTMNWLWFPWPPETQDIREDQWQDAVALWSDLSSFARANGVERIALELHPLQLVYNLPTVLRMRNAIGPVIGANVDPSHLFWQQIDPVRVVEELGEAVFHVHLKDSELFEDQIALNGVLDQRPWDVADDRSWIFRTVGLGHPAAFWSSFLDALDRIDYTSALSIENEDPLLPGSQGVTEAVKFMAGVIGARRMPDAR